MLFGRPALDGVHVLLFTALFVALVVQTKGFVPTAATSSHKQCLLRRSNDNDAMTSRNDGDDKTEVVGQMYGGLVFLKTHDRPGLVTFYQETIHMSVWLEQPDITILAHGNMLLGFHQQTNNDDDDNTADVSGMYTFVYPSKRQVDEMYQSLKEVADGPPRVNERYRIYQFFAPDPEGRKLEFQAFLHPLTVVSSQVGS